MEDTSAGTMNPVIVHNVLQRLLKAEGSVASGAARQERRPNERSSHRNGYRIRLLQTTQVGDVTLAMTKTQQARAV